jgi:hypothetical protein
MFGFGKKKTVFEDDTLQATYESLSAGKRADLDSVADNVHRDIHAEAHATGVGKNFFSKVFCIVDGLYHMSDGSVQFFFEDDLVGYNGDHYDIKIISSMFPVSFQLKSLQTSQDLFSGMIKPDSPEHVPSGQFNSGLSHLSLEIALWVLQGRNDFKNNIEEFTRQQAENDY